MSDPDNRSIDFWLDRWESAREKDPGLTVSHFLDEFAIQLPGDFVKQLEERILAIGQVDKLLNRGTKHAIGRISMESTNYDQTVLAPGWEPIDGYVLQTKLGSGGSGQVWKAIGPGGFEVALKFVPLESRAFEAEIRGIEISKRLKHPFLIETFGAWNRSGFLIIATELADHSLYDRLQDCFALGLPGIPRDELLGYIQEIAQVIDFLNESEIEGVGSAGVQHRDVKPENILVVGRHAKLGDLGIARLIKKQETGHTGRLTVNYAAPEFFSGKTTSTSDQYSLAVSYLHLRTGSLPFVGSELEIFRGHIGKKPNLASLPARERYAVARALSKKPELRWANCQKFIEAVRKGSSMSEQIEKREPSRAAASYRCRRCGSMIIGSESFAIHHCNRCFPRRKRKSFRLEAVAVLTSLAILAIGIAIVWFLMQAVQENDQLLQMMSK